MSGATMTAGTRARVVPGQGGMWFFILFEAFLFTSYFTVYMVCRSRDVDTYLASQVHLNIKAGVINTLVLLVSSWSMARCVQAARSGDLREAWKQVVLTAAFGVAFLVLKVGEWVVEAGNGFTFTSNAFSMFYYFLTGMHFLHLLIGFAFLGVVMVQLRRPGARTQVLVETGATYWHMVDFLWIMIFALLYVIR
jgi:nitric oxide reductase NorE protein